MITYLLNSPVLTDYGDWRFSGPIETTRAKELLEEGFESSIGHPGAAELLSLLLEVDVPVQRTTIRMRPGDRAIVLRLLQRLPAGALLTKSDLDDFPFELGLLECLYPAERR